MDIWQAFRVGFMQGWRSYWTSYTWVWVLIGFVAGLVIRWL